MDRLFIEFSTEIDTLPHEERKALFKDIEEALASSLRDIDLKMRGYKVAWVRGAKQIIVKEVVEK